MLGPKVLISSGNEWNADILQMDHRLTIVDKNILYPTNKFPS